MRSKASEVVAVLLGVGLIGLAYSDVSSIQGAFLFLVACLVGSVVTVFNLAALVLPPARLLRPRVVNGEVEFDTRDPSYTPLAWGLHVFGVATGGALYAVLRGGVS
jgi:hypothetical protein